MQSISDEEKQEKQEKQLFLFFTFFFLFLFSLINDTQGSLNKIATILVATFGGYLWWLDVGTRY